MPLVHVINRSGSASHGPTPRRRRNARNRRRDVQQRLLQFSSRQKMQRGRRVLQQLASQREISPTLLRAEIPRTTSVAGCLNASCSRKRIWPGATSRANASENKCARTPSRSAKRSA